MKIASSNGFLSNIQKEAKIFIEENNLVDAEKKLNNALNLDPKNLQTLRIYHELERARNNSCAALMRAVEMINHHPNYVGGYYRAVQDLIELKRFDEAEAKFDEVPKSNCSSKSYLIMKYRLYSAKGEPENALIIGDQYISLYPKDDWGYKSCQTQIKSINKKLRLAKNRRYLNNPPRITNNPDQQVNLNIGAGDTYIENFIGLDHDSLHYGGAEEKSQITYNMRTDMLPVKSETVDNIYISHVIEHIEDNHVLKFFKEASRVLKPGGCLRISCPDAEFLYNVSCFDNTYWYRRHPWFKARGIDYKECDQWDFLTRELCTPRLRYAEQVAHIRYKNENLQKTHNTLATTEKFLDAMHLLTNNSKFNQDFPGDHINYWSYDKIKHATKGLFRYVIRSKYQGCVHKEMTGEEFDQMGAAMSLYVDCVK